MSKLNEDCRVLQVGNFVNTGNWNNPQRGRAYSPYGISPTINTGSGGGHTPQIVIEAEKEDE